MPLFRIILILFSLAFLALNAWFLVYLDRLRKSGCKCAEGWRRQFMEYFVAVWLLLIVVAALAPVAYSAVMAGIVGALWFGLTIAFIVVTRQFIDQMVSSNCQCAETDAFWWLGVYNVFQIILLALWVLTVLIALLFSSSKKSMTASKASSGRRR